MKALKHLFVVAAFGFCAVSAQASTVNLGSLSFVASGNSTANEFDLDNFTGAASLIGCSADFQSCTPVTFSNLSLLVTFMDGSQLTVTPAGTLAAGDPTLTLKQFPLGTTFQSAFLSGNLTPTSLTRFMDTPASVESLFSATLNGAPLLLPGDTALVTVDELSGTAVPEPSTFLPLSALCVFLAMRLRRA